MLRMIERKKNTKLHCSCRRQGSGRSKKELDGGQSTVAIKSIRRSQVTDGTDEFIFWSTKMASKSHQSAKISPRASRAFSAMRIVH